MEADYKTNDPIIFTVCAVLIFAFTSAVFLVYDRLVEKRQKTVMTTAVHTSAIVSSLFPSTVRGRLFEAGNNGVATNNRLGHDESMCVGDKTVSRPIADLYPSATVLFADMYVLNGAHLRVPARLVGFAVGTHNNVCHLCALVPVSQPGAQAEIRQWSSTYWRTFTMRSIKLLTHAKSSKSKQLEIAVSACVACGNQVTFRASETPPH
jgi:NAD-dependent dihydropyrimidine dehydrogenase PreA subunit